MLKFHVPDKGSPRSSSRLRADDPAKLFGETISKPQDATADDVIVFAKKSTVNDVKYAVKNNIKFLFDICDDQFQDPTYKELFAYACDHCSAITVPSEKMKLLCEQKTSKETYVTLESYERESKPPQFNPGEVLNILFYGTYDNFDAVPWTKLVDQLNKNDIRFKINALVNCASGRKINSPNIEVHEWSFEKQTNFLDECDLVLLPFKNNKKNISTKSPNRVVEAINRGKFVVTNYGVDSYKELQDFIFLDDYDNIVEGIIWTLSNKKLVLQKIIDGQKFIHQKYNLTSVSNSWKHVYEILLGERKMSKVILCCIARNHLRLLVPMIESLCESGNEVLLYTSLLEVNNDSICGVLNHYLKLYSDRFYIMDICDESELIEYSKNANSLLVTSGTSNRYHKIDYDLCKKVHCKSFALQHGISQEAITRLTNYDFSADHVLTWIKKDLIPETVATPIHKFISVGVPTHYYDTTEKVEGSKVFFLANGFDKPNSQDLKLDTSGGEWSGIYTLKWKEETWDKILSLSNGPCYFVRHPICNGGNLHPKLEHLLKKDSNHLIDSSWLSKNKLNRSQLYSLGSKYYITYPSSSFIDCFLRGVDYELFIDYNSNVKLFTENSLEAINATDKICNLLTSSNK